MLSQQIRNTLLDLLQLHNHLFNNYLNFIIFLKVCEEKRKLIEFEYVFNENL